MNLPNNIIFRHLGLIIVSVIIILFLGKNLNPNAQTMFLFHDQTQAARISQFNLAVQSGQIPPRMAPDFSFRLEYPIFTYYAPGAYIITQIFSSLGFEPSSAIQLSFLLGLWLAFFGTYMLLIRFFSRLASLVGAVSYVTTLYVPLTIFVRGNLAEFWMMSLLPLGFMAILPSKKINSLGMILKVIVLLLLFTSHNALSLFACLYLFLYLIYFKGDKRQWITFGLGVLGSFYFYLPFILESSLTWAQTVALKTDFKDHFVCLSQLWNGLWGFGGSSPNCITDGMSYKLGKVHILLLLTSGMFVIRQLYSKDKKVVEKRNLIIFFISITLLAIFMTTSFSRQIWDRISILPLMQYPWRFLAFMPIGFAFASGYTIDNISKRLRYLLGVGVVIVMLIFSGKYFYGQNVLKSQYNHDFLTREYIQTKVAFLVPEYLPKTVDYEYWRESNMVYSQPVEVTSGNYEIIKNAPFQKIVKVAPQDKLTINVHYLPGWIININDKNFVPDRDHLDRLGRPFLEIVDDSIVSIEYKQTQIQIIGLACLVVAVILGAITPIYYEKKS